MKKQLSRLWRICALTCLLPAMQPAHAQTPGSTCSVALLLPEGGGCAEDQVFSASEAWYSFMPDSTACIIDLLNKRSGDSLITKIILYSGTCSTLTAIDSAMLDPMQYIQMKKSGLTSGLTYFLKTIQVSTKPGKFDLCFQNVSPASLVPCSCPALLIDPNNTCQLICNGDFEYHTQPPTTFSQLDFACPWQKIGGPSSSPDYFNGNSTNPLFSVPNNLGGSQTSLFGGSGYAGFIAYINQPLAWPDTREYIVQPLKDTMIAGQCYTVQFWICLADNSGFASRYIGAYLSQNLPVQNGAANLSVTPQIILNSYLVSGNWGLISGSYTATGGEKYITIGQFTNDATANPITSTPANSSAWISIIAYYLVDQVSVKPCNASIVATASPSTICSGSNTTLTATAQGTNLSYAWTPASSVNSPASPVTTANPAISPGQSYTCTITMSNYDNCTLSDTAYVNVGQTAKPYAGADVTICSGQSTTLTGSTLIGNQGSWSVSGGGGICTNCTTTSVSPTQTTSYIYSYTNIFNGCTNSDTVTVFIYPPPQVSIISPPYATTCSGAMTFSASGGSFTAMFWTSNGSPSNGTGSTFATNWNSSAANGIITLSVTNALGCSGSVTDTIPGCCISGAEPNLLNTQTSTLNAQFPALGAYNGPVYEIDGKTFTVNGLLTVDQNMSWKGCNVSLGMDARIVVSPGIKFEITANAALGTKMKACDYLWDGIYVDGTNTNSEVLVNSGSVIEDAQNAIVSSNGGKFTIIGSSTALKVKLNKNKIAVWVKKYNGTHPGTIRNSVISCDYASTHPGYTANWTSAGSVCRPPFSKVSLIGMKIDTVSNITLGDSTTNANRNLFERLRYGTYSKNSTVNVWNNTFKYIQPANPQQKSPADGVAVYSNNYAHLQHTLTVGRPGTVNAGNTFTSVHTGVMTEKYMNLSAQNNTLDTIGGAGVYLLGCKQRTQLIDRNGFQEFNIGVRAVDGANAALTVSNNSFNQTNLANPTSFGNTAILVQNAVVANGNVRIFNNNIRRIRMGILVSRVRSPKIYDNSQITFYPNQPATAASPAVGIKIEGCEHARVNDNSVSYNITSSGPVATSLHDKFFGIYVTNCFNDSVYKNTLTKMGSGIFLKGANNPGFISCNTMDKCAYAVNFNFLSAPQIPVSTSHQVMWLNTTPTPTGNVWTNCNKDIIGVIDPNNSINWYRNNSYVPVINMNNLSFVSNVTTNLGNVSDQCSALLIPADPNDQRSYMLDGIIKTPRTYDTLDPQFQYLDRVWAYRTLRDNPSWLSLQTADDALYQQFYADESNSAIGWFADAEDSLMNGQVAAAQTLLSQVMPNSEPEYNRLAVMQTYAESWAGDNYLLSAAQEAVLQTIIPQHPVSGGNAVFDARNMLNEEVHDDRMAEAGQEPANSIAAAEIRFYPNPADGLVKVDVPVGETDAAIIAVYDFTGRLVNQYRLATGTVHTLQTGMLQNGVYIFSVTVNGELKEANRIVILKQD